MKDYLSELDKETKKALETFYGFSEGKSKVRRSVDEWNSTGSDFFKQIPLLKFEDFSKTATELHSGQKRKIEGSVFHKDSSIVNSGDSNDIIGFQLVSAILPWPASSLWGSKGMVWVGIPPTSLIACLGGFIVTCTPPAFLLVLLQLPANWSAILFFLKCAQIDLMPFVTSP